jgi:hypothetical protein
LRRIGRTSCWHTCPPFPFSSGINSTGPPFGVSSPTYHAPGEPLPHLMSGTFPFNSPVGTRPSLRRIRLLVGQTATEPLSQAILTAGHASSS